jgi:hypothetical protein
MSMRIDEKIGDVDLSCVRVYLDDSISFWKKMSVSHFDVPFIPLMDVRMLRFVFDILHCQSVLSFMFILTVRSIIRKKITDNLLENSRVTSEEISAFIAQIAKFSISEMDRSGSIRVLGLKAEVAKYVLARTINTQKRFKFQLFQIVFPESSLSHR